MKTYSTDDFINDEISLPGSISIHSQDKSSKKDCIIVQDTERKMVGIFGRRDIKGTNRFEYLVKFKNYPLDHKNDWYSRDAFKDRRMVDDFDKSFKMGEHAVKLAKQKKAQIQERNRFPSYIERKIRKAFGKNKNGHEIHYIA